MLPNLACLILFHPRYLPTTDRLQKCSVGPGHSQSVPGIIPGPCNWFKIGMRLKLTNQNGVPVPCHSNHPEQSTGMLLLHLILAVLYHGFCIHISCVKLHFMELLDLMAKDPEPERVMPGAPYCLEWF